MDFSRMTLLNLKREKTNKVFELQELHERSQSNFTIEDQKQWDILKLDIDEIESFIRKAEVREQAQKNTPFLLDQNNAHKFLKGHTSRSKNILGRILKASQSNADEEVRGLTSSGGTTMIPADRIQEVIFDLESQNDLVNAGASFIFSEQNFQWPRVTNKGTAYYQPAELDAITDSSPTIGSVKADLKDVAIRFIVSNQLLMDSSENVERILQNAMIEKINQTVLEAVFSGSGESGQPTGLNNLTNILTVDAGGTKLTDYKYHIQAVKKLLDANMPMENLSVFGSPDSLQQLEYLTDTTGQPIMQPKMIDRLNQFYTSAIATNYGASTDETKLYFGDYTRLLVAYQGPFTILTDQSASKLATEVIMHYRFDLLYLSPDSFCRVDNIETGLPVEAI